MERGTAGAIGLLGARPTLDDRIDSLEMARVRRQRDLDLARSGLARTRGGEVVLDVTRTAFWVGDNGVDRPLTLELAQDRLVRAADRVTEDVQAPAMGHPDHDLVRAVGGGDLDRLVEHRDEHVEPFERELLLAEERLAQVLLQALHLRQATEQRNLPVRRERLPEPPRLDRLAQPDALGVVGDVLDLVGDRAAVDLAQPRQRLEETVPLNIEPEQPGGYPRLQLRGERRYETRLVERRIACRLGAKRVEPRREVTVHPVGLHERHRRGDAT